MAVVSLSSCSTVKRKNNMLDASKIAGFKASLRGQFIEPSDQGYDEARSLYNGMIDKRPLHDRTLRRRRRRHRAP